MLRKADRQLVREEVPQSMIDVAVRRVAPHLDHLAMVDYNLRQLLVNCYMQGVIDTVTGLPKYFKE